MHTGTVISLSTISRSFFYIVAFSRITYAPRRRLAFVSLSNYRIQGDWLRLPPPFGLLTEIGVVLPLVLTLEVSSSLLTLVLPSRRGGGVL